MLDRLKQDVLAALRQAIVTRYGDLELPTLTLGLPPNAELGDFTFGAFPLAKPLRKAPAVIAKEVAERLEAPFLKKVEAVGPYLNLTLEPAAWFEALCETVRDPEARFGFHEAHRGERVMVEFSSPNTNKPLHIGHVRNNLLGWSVSQLLRAVGYEVVRACLVNDRGIHICKSMLAYQRFFPGQTPASRGQKGDHFVGDCYVAFEQALKREKDELSARFSAEGLSGEALQKRIEAECSLLRDIREMLRAWEAGDPEVRALWKQMNDWVYDGFNETYRALGVSFDRFYYESELYTKGKALVLEALSRGLVERREDGSIWVDLSSEGMDPKVLLRSDGTSLYITQDLGVALQKQEDHQLDRSIYVIGNEQDHQMKALFATLKRLGFSWADGLFHLSYGMVYLPEGRMKSREGKVVDADDLITEMKEKAREKAIEARAQDPRRESEALSEEELEARARMVGLGAIKFYMLKTNPRKDFTFNPEESIQLQGDTGPYVQYTHARVKSILRRAAAEGLSSARAREAGVYRLLGNLEERELARILADFPRVVLEAADRLMPSNVTSYLVDVAAAYNKFYHNHSVLSASSPELVLARLTLTEATGLVLARGLELLGIEAPEAM